MRNKSLHEDDFQVNDFDDFEFECNEVIKALGGQDQSFLIAWVATGAIILYWLW